MKYCIMNFLIVFIFNSIYISSIQSDSLPDKTCEFEGKSWPKSGFQFSLSDLPTRCKAVVYGYFYFDQTPYANDEDIKTITALISANIFVYIRTGYMELDSWEEILDSKEPFENNKKIEALIQFFNNTKANGLIIEIFDLYDTEKMTDLATKISTFLCKMREKLPTVKYGLSVNGNNYEKFSQNAFDFSITNPALDLYIIELAGGMDGCNANRTLGGSTPTATIEAISKATSESKMEKNKLFVSDTLYAVTQDPATQEIIFLGYSDYCARGSAANCTDWCRDTTQIAYDEGKFLKPLFQGIFIGDLATDDSNATCGCEKFPITNTVFDGWDSVPMKECPALK